MCIPDRDSADNELTRLRHKHGPNLIKAVTRKDAPSMRGGRRGKSPGNYTLRYFDREASRVRMFKAGAPRSEPREKNSRASRAPPHKTALRPGPSRTSRRPWTRHDCD